MILPEARDLVAIEPKTKADQDKLGRPPSSGLPREDPTFRVRSDEEDGADLIAGMCRAAHLGYPRRPPVREFAVDAERRAAPGGLPARRINKRGRDDSTGSFARSRHTGGQRPVRPRGDQT